MLFEISRATLMVTSIPTQKRILTTAKYILLHSLATSLQCQMVLGKSSGFVR